MAQPPFLVNTNSGVPVRAVADPAPRLPNPIPFIVTVMGVGAGFLAAGAAISSPVAAGAMVAGGVIGAIVGSAFRIAAQWEKGIVFRFGKYVRSTGPGLFFLMPFVDSVRVVDTRIMTLDVPHRQAITKDNVPVKLDGVIFLRVTDPSAAVIRVQNYTRAVLEYAQTALRDIVGGMTLDEILADRELLGRRVEEMVEAEIDGWGLDVAAIRIQDIELPEDLKRVMARQASAEREKRATITKAEGDAEAANNLAMAAERMAAAPGALQLRTLQTLDSLGASSSNTVVLAVPIEMMQNQAMAPALVKALAPKEGSEPPKHEG
ncbi:MAG: SPFH domain-containing protein [Fimbriimonadaceae bacterium]|nr:SPFH domain-containing protein [Fimbriimonadaceae bacterium]